jgi:hypothetical protein
MRRLLLFGLLSTALLPSWAKAQNVAAGYTNNGEVENQPVDAVNFVNNGTFVVGGIRPYETSDTLNFVNNSLMYGWEGFWLTHVPAGSGQRSMAASFINNNLATVQAYDLGLFANSALIIGVPNNGVVAPSIVRIWAANIVNRGELQVGANGLLELAGNNVDVSRGELNVLSIQEEALGTFKVANTNFFVPDIAISDLTWALAGFDNNLHQLFPFGLWAPSPNALNPTGTNAASQSIASSPAGPAAPTSIPSFSFLFNSNSLAVANSYMNVVGTGLVVITNSPDTNVPPITTILITNINKGAVFVLPPTGFKTQARFTPGLSNYDNIIVRFAAPEQDQVGGVAVTNYVYFEDDLASGQSSVLLANIVTADTFRPTNYWLDRLPHSTIFDTNISVSIVVSNNVLVTNTIITPPASLPGQGMPEINFLTDSGNYTNPLVSFDSITNSSITWGQYAGYQASIDSAVSRPLSTTSGGITNTAGSILISSKNLNLDNTRMRANGVVSIKTSNLISSTNTVIDCDNLSFDLGAASGNLTFQNLALPRTGRIRGTISAWSAFWTNTVIVVIPTNYVFTTSGSNTIAVLTPITNTIGVGYHVLVLDASGLGTNVPVNVYDLNLHATQMTMDDSVTVYQSLFLDGRSFTLNGSLSLNTLGRDTSPSWVGTNAPHLLFFTNNGSLSIPNQGVFGYDRPTPYSTFVNGSGGSLSAAGIQVKSAYFENAGSLTTIYGSIFVQCGSGLLQNGNSSAGYSVSGFTLVGDCRFSANTLVISNYQLSANGALSLSVSNLLTDYGSANSISVQSGFNLLVKPQTGDLLGTTITDSGQNISPTILHTWAGEDRGPTPAGYLNNTAIGRLTLVSNSAAVFEFKGASTKLGVTNAMYVDLLDVSSFGQGLGLHQLRIDPNMIIYYAAVKVSPTNIFFPNPNGLVMQPEEYLDGYQTQPGGGRLRWVRDYAGANSSTTALINSNGVIQIGSINSALRNSQIIDSDGNGITNANESSFKVAPVTVQITGNGTVAPNYGGQGLLVGETYKMAAQPSVGAKFLGWTGDMTSSPPALTFTVPAAGLHLVANFSYPTAASYSGLFYESSGIEFLKSGAIGLTTTAKGGYTGTLKTGARNYSFSGHLDSNGAGTNSAGPYTVQLQLSDDQITGTVSSNAVWSADFVLNRAVFNGTTSRAPYAGKYTILLPGSEDPTDTQNPQGDSYGFVTIDTSGNLQFSGALADGTPMSLSAKVSKDGLWPLFFRLPNGNGQVLSWQTFANIGNVSGLFSWIKQPNPNAKRYPLGFNFPNNSLGSSYNPSLAPVTGFTQNGLVLQGANLYAPIISTVTLNAANMVTKTAGGNRLSLTLTPSRGLFRGSVFDVNSGKTVNFSGAILQNLGFGSGFFLNTNLCGQVYFGP